MIERVNRQILLGFIDEARGYLPRIVASLDACRGAAEDDSSLEEAHRLLHSIRGAASMVGLNPLAHLAALPEALLAEVWQGEAELDEESLSLLHFAVSTIETYLDCALDGSVDDGELLGAVLGPFRRHWGLPEGDDEAELARLLEPEEGWEGGTGGEPAAGEAEGVEPELLETFLEEAEDHLQEIGRALAELVDSPAPGGNLVAALRRSVHTLKGSAGVVGLTALGRLAHRMEDLLASAAGGEAGWPEGALSLFEDSYHLLEDLVGHGSDAEALAPAVAELEGRYDRLLARGEGAGRGDTGPGRASAGTEADGTTAQEGTSASFVPFAELAPPEGLEDAAGVGSSGPAEAPPVDPGQVLRVPLDRVDELVRLVGELSVNRAGFQDGHGSLVQLVHELTLSAQRVRRLSAQLAAEYEVTALRRVVPGGAGAPAAALGVADGFDDLELDRYTEFHRIARQLTEAAADLAAVKNQFSQTVGWFDGSLSQLGRLTGEIQDGLLRLRMVPVGRLALRLRRAARRAAQQKGKRVELQLLGEGVELDKTVFEKMVDPLLHLVRNAVDHGIEEPEERRRRGKPEAGRLELRAYHAGPEVVLEVADDGAGLDEHRLATAAVAGGYASRAEVSGWDRQQLHNLIFAPGFSTAGEVSQLSGRGVGLDVVREAVLRLKGSVAVSSSPGGGVTFTIRLPITLAVARVLLVEAGQETYALPLAGVTQILRLEGVETEAVGGEPVLSLGDRVVPVLELAAALGDGSSEVAAGRRRSALLLRLGDKDFAFAVDRVVGEREVVVKSLGRHLRQVRGVTGATLLGDGSVVLILNPADFVAAPATPIPSVHGAAAPRAGAGREILIVDDSLSVRRALARIVSDAGWTPQLARDGLEALEMLQRGDCTPRAILLDIEMPRMDGYQLTATLRAEESFRHIPILIVTSRASERHRQKAFELGADDYLVKPLHETLLIDRLARLGGDGPPPAAGGAPAFSAPRGV